MDSDELKARGVHRRVQRLKARFSPTASYGPLPSEVVGDAASDGGDAAASSAASSNPPAASSTPAPASSSTPVQSSTSPTSSAAQPATSSTAAPATSATSTSTTDSTTSTSTTSTSSSSTSTSSTSSQTSTSATSASAAPASSNSPTATKETQASQAQQHSAATAASVTGHVTGSGSPTLSNTLSLQASASATSADSNTADSSSGAHTGTIVGIVVAVIVGVVGIVFAVTYFMRRARRERDDDFSPEAFRRQSAMLPDPDPPVVPDRGITPRPPSMIQQRLAQGPVSYNQHPYGGNNGYYGYDQPSFAPGQVVAMPGQPMPPQAWTPDSSRPFFAPMGESPMGSPVSVAPYDSQYDAHGQLVRQPSPGPNEFLNRQGSMGAVSQLNRQPSAGPNEYLNRQPSVGAAIQLNRQPSLGPGQVVGMPPPPMGMPMEAPDHSHYVDLNRSSVSPFQAEQYAEISHKLNTTPPEPLPTPLVAAAAEKVITEDEEYFHEVSTPLPLNVPAQPPRSPTGSPFNDAQVVDDLPKPPSPTLSRKTHVDSMPPTLPEIQQRSFSPVTLDFPMNGPASPALPAPSPLSASVAMPAAPAQVYAGNGPASPQFASHNGAQNSAPPTPRPANNNTPAARPDTVYTMYDDDDAYGGI